MSVESESVEIKLVYPDALDCRGLDLGKQDLPDDPVEQFILKVRNQESFRKNSCGDEEPDWDEPLGAPVVQKRASRPGKVLLEKTTIDGETWVFGYDSIGECVYSNVITSNDIKSLEKRHGEPHGGSGHYTAWLQKQIASGKSPREAIEEWSDANPNADPDIVEALLDAAEELESA